MTHNPAALLSIVAYKPKPGKEAELRSLVEEHVPYLRSLGLATDRPQILATSADGTHIEVFEWTQGGIERAHAHAGLLALWKRFMDVCDIVPLQTLHETSGVFANFVPAN